VTAAAPERRPAGGLGRKAVWITAFYFASGFPFGLLQDFVPVYLRTLGVDLAAIGLLSLLQIPYTFKFAWAPLLDWIGTRRQWILAAQIGLALLVPAVVVAAPASFGWLAWVLLLAIAVLSATQDMAVDAFAIEQLDEREYGLANGLRVGAYRVAMIVAGGLLLALGGQAGWRTAFVAAGATMLAVAALTFALAPSTRRAPRPAAVSDAADAAAGAEPRRAPPAGGRLARLAAPVWRPLAALFDGREPRYVAAALLFVLTFKLGDLSLLPMIRPFWVDSGYSPEQIGFIVGTVGMVATIAGALAGGLLTSRLGTFRALWMLGLVQALSNLGYYAAARSGAQLPVMYGAAIVEQFTTGLGTAAFLTFLMDLCDRSFAATQYALLSALFRVGGIVAGALSGYLAESLGFASYFLLTFALAFPAFALLPWIARLRARGLEAPG
jgi:PAT family beta-lactamase induction signal transducer AmpG